MTIDEVLVTLGNAKEWGGGGLLVYVDGSGNNIQTITLKVESDSSISKVTLNTEEPSAD